MLLYRHDSVCDSSVVLMLVSASLIRRFGVTSPTRKVTC